MSFEARSSGDAFARSSIVFIPTPLNCCARFSLIPFTFRSVESEGWVCVTDATCSIVFVFSITCSCVIVGGGGGGTYGGGGAGGFLTSTTSVSNADYTITVGGGGASSTNGTSS